MSVEFTTTKMNEWHERGSNQKFWSGSEFSLMSSLLDYHCIFRKLKCAPKSGLDVFRLESSSIPNRHAWP